MYNTIKDKPDLGRSKVVFVRRYPMHVVDDDLGRLVVVLCTERSGSTLLSMVLGGHSHITAPPEMHMLRYGDYNTWRAEFPQALSSLIWLLDRLGQPSDPLVFEERFRDRGTLDIYRELLKACGRDRLIVDKTPAYARDCAILARLERLNPIYIWLIRHPLAVAASMLKRRRDSYWQRQNSAHGAVKNLKVGVARVRNWIGDANGTNLREQIQKWCSVHTRIEGFLETIPIERSVKVHYEQMVTNPKTEVDRISNAIGVSVEPAMFRPQENAPQVLEWDLGDQQVLQFSGIEARSVDIWRDQYSEELLDQNTCKVMERIGVVRDITGTSSFETAR